MAIPGDATRWLTRGMQPDAPLQLVCFPYAGGSAASFAGWQEALGPGIELRVVQLPGRGMRLMEPPQPELQQLVAELAQALPTALAGRPFAFFGHSMGGLLAFALCRHLVRCCGALPARLFISGCQSPAARRPFPRHHELPDAALIEVLRGYRGTPEELLRHAELMDLLLPAIRADFQIVADYRHEAAPSLPVPISALYGTEDSIDDPRCISAWQDETSAGSERVPFEGGHFFLHSAQAAVIHHLRRTLRLHLEKVC
jgi:surfactin synthase thioesterase subunit